MGAVHLARDLTLDRLVAVKELPAEFASDSTLRERFLREVRMAASFSHPNIVPVYAVEEDGESLAFVMGYVEGESLADRVRRSGPLSARETVRLLLDVAYALAYAHGRGVVHRDMKPDNIMIERATGRALLMDFGVARSISTSPNAQAGMTRVGEVVGTPEYMSPEQATGEEIDGRSDLYSLGLTAYFAVTGNAAYSGDSAARILVRQLTETLPTLATVRPDLPPALADAIDRCLAKEREDRFADAAALIEALDAAQAAAPEIPLVMRLLSNELSTLQTLGIFCVFVALLAFNVVLRSGWRDLTALLPCLVVASAFTGRLLQTRAEVRRIRAAGFSGSDMRRGVLAVLAEREERRQQLRIDGAIVAQRRSTARLARILLGAALLSAFWGFNTRTVINGTNITPPLGIALVFTAMISFGLSVVLLLRNPLKVSADERFFRTLWLGPIGRTLFGFAESERTPAASGSTRPVRAAATLPAAVANRASPVDARLDDLESRVRRLEQR
jgi:serine/threonine-protein kinase